MKCCYCNNEFIVCKTKFEYLTKINKINDEVALAQEHFSDLLNKNGDFSYYHNSIDNSDINRRTFDKLCSNYKLSKKALLLFSNYNNFCACPANRCNMRICNNCYYQTHCERR
jgi:endonuclease IV